MKKTVFVFASAMMLIACAKETIDNSVIETPANVPDNGTAVTLTAIMPGFTSDTKAAIADDGTFSWTDGENADKIAVRYVKEGAADEYVTFSCTNAETGEFTGEPSDGYEIASSGVIAYYPSDYRGTPSAYSGSAADAGKSFQMKAEEFVNGELLFQHDNALLKVTVNNVPSITTSLVIGSANIALSSFTGGNLTLYVPTPAVAAAALTIQVKMGNDVLFQKSTSNSVAIQKGYIYTHIPTLSVVPDAVYLVRNIDGDNWDQNSTTLMSNNTGTTYSATLKSSAGNNQNKFFRVDTKYSDSISVQYGNEDANVDGSSGGTFIGNSDNAALIAIPDGVTEYVIGFDFVSGAFTLASSEVDLYLIGSPNSWNASEFTNKSNKITRAFGNTYLWKGTTKSADGFKLFEDGVTDWGIGVYPNANSGTQIGDGVAAGSDRTIIFNLETNTGSCNTGFAATKVVIRGSIWDSWGTDQELTKTDYPGIWKISDLTVGKDGAQLKFVVNGTWSGAGSEDGEVSMNANRSHLVYGNDDYKNLAISEGTYDIYFNDAIWHYYVDEK